MVILMLDNLHCKMSFEGERFARLESLQRSEKRDSVIEKIAQIIKLYSYGAIVDGEPIRYAPNKEKNPITPVNLIIIEYISIAVIFSFSLTEFITLPCIAGTINALVIPVIPEAKYASNKKFWF